MLTLNMHWNIFLGCKTRSGGFGLCTHTGKDLGIITSQL